MPVSVLVKIEGRNIPLHLQSGNFQSLERSFNGLCQKDPILKTRLGKYMPTFKVKHKDFEELVELDRSARLPNKTIIEVAWASWDLQLPEAGPAEQVVSETPAQQPSDTNTNDFDELQFLSSIGLQQSGSKSAEVPGPSGVKETLPSASAPRARGRSTVNNSSDDDDNDYARLNEDKRAENATRLKQLNIMPPKPGPSLKKRKRGKGKENTGPQVQQRVQPVRAVRLRTQVLPNSSADEAEADDDPDDVQAQDVPPSGPPAGMDKHATDEKSRRHPKKRRRLMGQRITKYTIFPPFPERIKRSIMDGKLYKTIKDSEEMNNYLIELIHSITGDLYPSKEEYKIIGKKVVRKLQCMKAPDTVSYKVVKKKLNAAIRGRRAHNYRRQKKIMEHQTAACCSAKRQAGKPAPDKSSLLDFTIKMSEEEAEELLKKPVLNMESVKNALTDSTSRVTFILNHPVQQSIDTYPYLSNADLLIHDYMTRVPILMNDAWTNFENCIQPLATLFDKAIDPICELHRIQMIKEVEIHFHDGDAAIYPCLQFWDEANTDVLPLDNVPEGQSPAVVIIVNDISIVSATLVFDGRRLTTSIAPTAFASTALVLAAYYVFHLAYPKPYANFLKALDVVLHDDFDEEELCKEMESFQEFVNKLRKAKKK